MVQIIRDTATTLTIIRDGRQDSYVSAFTASADGNTGNVFIRGNAQGLNREEAVHFSALRITDGENGLSGYTPTSAKDALDKLRAFIGNFRSSGGSQNTPSFYHSPEATIAGFIANDAGLAQLRPGMYVVLNGADPIRIYLYVGDDPTQVGSYALVSVSSIMWDNIQGKPSSAPADIDYMVANAVVVENGSWNPLINGNPLSNYTATAVDASYTKIGNRVNIRGYIAFTSAQSSSEQVIFTNLPFVSIAGRRQPVYIDAQGLVSNGLIKGMGGMIHPSTRNLQLYYNEEVSGLWARPSLNMTRVGAGSSFEFNFDYTTSG